MATEIYRELKWFSRWSELHTTRTHGFYWYPYDKLRSRKHTHLLVIYHSKNWWSVSKVFPQWNNICPSNLLKEALMSGLVVVRKRVSFEFWRRYWDERKNCFTVGENVVTELSRPYIMKLAVRKYICLWYNQKQQKRLSREKKKHETDFAQLVYIIKWKDRGTKDCFDNINYSWS